MEKTLLTQHEWQQFQQQAQQVFQRMRQQERLKMWAILGESLMEQATERQIIGVLAGLMEYAGRCIKEQHLAQQQGW